MDQTLATVRPSASLRESSSHARLRFPFRPVLVNA